MTTLTEAPPRPASAWAPSRSRVAMMLSCDSFEGFFGGTFGLDRKRYLEEYRNDFAWEYGEGLHRLGHEVFLYILSYGPPALHQVKPGFWVRFLPLPRWLRAADALLYRTRHLPHGMLLRDAVAHAGYRRALDAALAEDRIALFYIQEFWTPRFDILARHARLPVIGADHGALRDRRMDRRLRVSMRRAAMLICQIKHGVEEVTKLGGRAVLMPNGVDAALFSPLPAGTVRPKTILAVGRLEEPQKRLSDLIAAMPMLPDFTLTIIGRGRDGERLQQLADRLGVAPRVHFAGFVADRAVLREHYRSCGVFVSTSAWEAMALVMLEAMSCGAPVVGTEIPSFQEILRNGENGYLVPVGAPERLAEAVRAAHENQAKLGAAARETVLDRYNAAKVYAQLSEVIEAAVAGVEGAGKGR